MKASGRFATRKFMAVKTSFATFDPSNSESIFRNTPTVKLLSTAFLFKVLSNTTAVNFFTRHANTIFLQGSDSVIKLISGYTMKCTIFPYFCAGENFLDCMSLAKTMHEDDKILTIADHSSEDLDDEMGFDSNADQKVELLKSIGKVGCSGIRFVPLKCTSLIDSEVLERLTLTLTGTESLCVFNPNDEESFASADDSEKFRAGLTRFQNICDIARANNLGILLDAEQSNRQPAIEVIAKILFEQYNILGKNPVLYNTYQTYLKRTPAALLAGMDAAQSKGYVFAVKLVRGAYMHSERESFAKRINDGATTGTEPVWETKDETDAAYNDAIGNILQRISNNDNNITSNGCRSIPHVMIASHNRTSIQLALAYMAELNIANDNPNVHFAQILGMSDHLTVSLARSGYNTSKLLIYGPFEKLFPWLLRRLDENKDLFGAMQMERKIYMKEIERRFSII